MRRRRGPLHLSGLFLKHKQHNKSSKSSCKYCVVAIRATVTLLRRMLRCCLKERFLLPIPLTWFSEAAAFTLDAFFPAASLAFFPLVIGMAASFTFIPRKQPSSRRCCLDCTKQKMAHLHQKQSQRKTTTLHGFST